MKSSGFTMIELIVTMVIVGILAIAVAPRFTQINTFEARTFHDRTLTMLRHAQKVAVAQRRNVVVNVDAGTGRICLGYAPDANCSNAVGVPGPEGQAKYVETAPAGVTLSATVEFTFSGLGNASQAVSFNVVGDGTTRPVTVVQDTGYVY